MNRTWNKYYSKYNYSLSNILLHYPYLIRAICLKPKTILEIGCGPAQHTIFLKKVFPNIKASVLDLDEKLLKKVELKYSNTIENYFHMDIHNKSSIKKLPKFDLIISEGLLEYFNDKDVVKIINIFSFVASKMIFSVPSDVYQNQDFGNETLRSKREMEKLLKKTGFKFKVHNYFFDVGFRTKFNLISQNSLGFYESLKLLLFKSCHLLIEINY